METRTALSFTFLLLWKEMELEKYPRMCLNLFLKLRARKKIYTLSSRFTAMLGE